MYSSLHFELHTNETTIQSGTATIIPLSTLSLDVPSMIHFRITKTGEDDHIAREMSIETEENKVILPACNEHETLSFSLPISSDRKDQFSQKVCTARRHGIIDFNL
jgi:hypothetical protein